MDSKNAMTTPQPQSHQHYGHALAGILGPAFVAAVAYVDYRQRGCECYFRSHIRLSAGMGARSGQLYERAHPIPVSQTRHRHGPESAGDSGRTSGDAGRFMFFMQAEVIAIATDLAEVIGGAIALKLLFGLPLFVGGCIIGAISTVLLIFQKGPTHRLFEKMIIALLLVITFGFIAGLFIDPPNPTQVATGLIPRFKGSATVLMAASMLGATVMPHAIYLHSTLVNDHYSAGQKKPDIKTLLHGSKVDVVWALLLAGTVNLALLILAANSLYGVTGTDSIEGAQHAIVAALGPVIGTIFSIGLLASSLSSTSVGTYAGAEIMHGLLRVKAPMWACRVVTLVPALIVLWFAKNPTEALIIGQVILSIGIPFAIIPLMKYTHDRSLMGDYVDGPVKFAINMIVVSLIVALNVILVFLTLSGRS